MPAPRAAAADAVCPLPVLGDYHVGVTVVGQRPREWFSVQGKGGADEGCVRWQGGSGKTSLASLLIRHLAAQDLPVVAVDADINQHLAEALGADRQPPAMAARLGSAATAGEGTQNLLCAVLAAGVLLGVAANAAFGWWLDGCAGLAVAAVAIGQGRGAWRGMAAADSGQVSAAPSGASPHRRGACRDWPRGGTGPGSVLRHV
jgi:hypothetical protein